MTKIYKKMIKKCDKVIDFDRINYFRSLNENLKEFEKNCNTNIIERNQKIQKIKSNKITENCEMKYDLIIFENEKKLFISKIKRSQALRKKVFEKLNKEFPKNNSNEFKYDIKSSCFENVVLGYNVSKDWCVTGIYHNTKTKETFTTSLLYNSDVDYFNEMFVFNYIISEYNIKNFKVEVKISDQEIFPNKGLNNKYFYDKVENISSIIPKYRWTENIQRVKNSETPFWQCSY